MRPPTLHVTSAYDAVAASYDAAFTRPVDLAENALVFGRLRTLLHNQPQARVLDVGCGTGLLLDELPLPPPRYVGLDVAPGMLAQARQKFLDYDFCLGDMADLAAFADDSFGLVVNLFGSFNYSTDPAPVLSEMQRVLQPGGHFLLMACTPRYAHRQSYILRASGNAAPLCLWRAGDLRAVFQHAAPELDVTRCWGLHVLPDRVCGWLPARLVLPLLWLEQHTVGRLFPTACYFLVLEGSKRDAA
jgi:ubiquinone/menaquinone biosynthesis C-methylase UbiE